MRREERKPVSRPAKIELGEGQVLSCRIADTSRGGALLLIENAEWLPKSFVINDTFSGTRRRVRVRWTSPNRVGVQYVDAGAAPMAHRSVGFGKRV
ncbi:MAG: PilZ domain-containing protein [Proteobacteria bacterium]|nr:PilZ domain-containing protein [Pseudomonadota bacterium]